jgi:hypothetical protein
VSEVAEGAVWADLLLAILRARTLHQYDDIWFALALRGQVQRARHLQASAGKSDLAFDKGSGLGKLFSLMSLTITASI